MYYKIAILDDEKQFIDIIESVIEESAVHDSEKYMIKRYDSGFQFLDDLENEEYFDIYLLDIEMPNHTGIEIAHKIRQKTKAAEAVIIFITAHVKYAIEGYQYRIFRYIPKAYIKEQLPLALEDAEKILSCQDGKYIYVSTSRFDGKVYFKNIIYIYKEEKNSVFVLTHTDKSLKYRKTLSELSVELPEDDFIFIDRCYIVNLQYIEGLEQESGKLLLRDGKKLMISKSRIREAKKIINSYWSRYI